MAYSIYLVEDDNNLNEILKFYLEKEGFIVTSFYNGKTAREAIKDNPHLWILDIMLPDIDGYQLVKEIKEYNIQIPVIFISACNLNLDKCRDGDDHLAKPFLPKELIVRIKKLLERV